MDMRFYERSFTLSEPSCKSVRTLMFSEIQVIIDGGGAKHTTDEDSAVKVVTQGNK